ncbi:MAG: hypothetical protein IH627_17020 [Rubrivivax sp.]|nr:hypothetical protein [Rubrivivax sp.]
MTGRLQHLSAVAVMAFPFTALFGAEVRAAAGSCQSRSDGKFDCMEFVGTLPAERKPGL